MMRGNPVSRKNKAEIEVDPHAPEIAHANNRNGKIYRKVTEVQASSADVVTLVETVLADGDTETKNVAKPGDFIVTAPGGERYVVKPDTFRARYTRKSGNKEVYVARGHIVAISNPFGRPISIKAPWGEMQYGSADCVIADIFDPTTKKMAGEPYIIAREEFARTYKLVRASKTAK